MSEETVRSRRRQDDEIRDNDDGGDDEVSERGGRGGRGGGGHYCIGNRSCTFLVKGKYKIDYKDVETLRQYVTETGKIRPRRQTGACSKCQRELARAVKRARHIALLPYAPSHTRRVQ